MVTRELYRFIVRMVNRLCTGDGEVVPKPDVTEFSTSSDVICIIQCQI